MPSIRASLVYLLFHKTSALDEVISGKLEVGQKVPPISPGDALNKLETRNFGTIFPMNCSEKSPNCASVSQKGFLRRAGLSGGLLAPISSLGVRN